MLVAKPQEAFDCPEDAHPLPAAVQNRFDCIYIKKIHPHFCGWKDSVWLGIYSQLPALLFQLLPASPIFRPAYAPLASASS